MHHGLCKLYTSYRIVFYVSCVQVVYKICKVGKQWLGTRGTTGTPATYINRNSFLYKLCKPLAYVYASYVKLHETCVHRRLSSLSTFHFIPPVPEVG